PPVRQSDVPDHLTLRPASEAAMTDDLPHPHRSDRIRARLRTVARRTAHSLELDPSEQAVVLDLAALAIARLAWRNSPVEDWHAAPDSRISDAEMMRATTSITRHVR